VITADKSLVPGNLAQDGVSSHETLTASFCAREPRGSTEGIKKLGVWPVNTILGMPLHREHEELSRQLQRLHYFVRGSCDDDKPAPDLVHALMVARIYDELVDSQNRSQPAVGGDRYCVDLLPLPVALAPSPTTAPSSSSCRV